MTGHNLPNHDDVVRYIKPSLHEDGIVDGSLFRLRENENGVSIHWLQCFLPAPKAKQLEKIRGLTRLEIKGNGRWAEFNVGQTREHLKERLPEVRFVHEPLKAIDQFKADPSHSEIKRLPDSDSPEAELIGDMIVQCITFLHPGLT